MLRVNAGNATDARSTFFRACSDYFFALAITSRSIASTLSRLS
jgi:hypothetical protein